MNREELRARIGPMALFAGGAGLAGLGSGSQFVYLIFGAVLGTAFAFALYWMWRERTRPVRNGVWFLLHLVWAALLVLSAVSPIKGFVIAVPVALWWLHDMPSSPTTMLTWGILGVLWQPFELWQGAAEDSSGVEWIVVTAALVFIGAAQWERERLARRRDAPIAASWMWARMGIVCLWSVVFILAREGLQAVSVFTALGIDVRGISGRVAMLAFIVLSLAVAGLLFRVRPEKSRPVAVPQAAPKKVDFDAAEPAKASGKAQAKATQRPAKKVDFDAAEAVAPTRAAPTKGARAPVVAERRAKAPAKPEPQPAAKAPAKRSSAKAKSEEPSKHVDFD